MQGQTENCKNMLLSIIVPVYNVEAYIEKCIISLQDQDIPKEAYEIIIINDGSPDNSKEVILKLMKHFQNIVFIDQENKGVSLARNAGMEVASGKFLLFIDPDDYVVPNSFNRMLQAAMYNEAQIVFLGFEFLKRDGSLRKEMFYREIAAGVYNGMDAYHHSRTKDTLDPDRIWAILFDRDFINKKACRFISNVPYLEDGEFISRVLCLAESCVFEHTPFYMRTTREGSATNSNLFFADKAMHGFLNASGNLKLFYESPQLSSSQREFMNQPVVKFVLLTIESSFQFGNWQRMIIAKKKLKEFGLGKLSLEKVRHPFKIYGRLYNISPFCFIAYLFLIKFRVSMKVKLNRLTNIR